MPFDDLMETLCNKTCPPPHPSLVCQMWEIFSPPRICPVVRAQGGKAKRSIDLTTFWDLRDPKVQYSLISDQITLQPYSTWLCPPCTYLSQLMFSNWDKMMPVIKDEQLQEALGYLDVATWVAEVQVRLLNYYAHEHPEGAQSWGRPNAF